MIELFSEDRLRSYGLGQVSESLVIKRYKWNIALSEALYPTLALLEVALRNCMDAALINLYGNEWLDESCKCWSRTPSMIKKGLPNPEQNTIARAREKLKKKKKNWHRSQLVAELSFGFWVNLFKSDYHILVWHQKQKPMKDVFRQDPKISPKQAYRTLDQIRTLRNRIAHHEPIWNKASLYEDYQSILSLLSALDGSLKDMAGKLDRFPEVWKEVPK